MISLVKQPLSTVTILAHNKSEWFRMAQDAYEKGHLEIGDRYMELASREEGSRMDCLSYDKVQSVYRAWLVFGWAEALKTA